jgi:hypothetical protein
MRSMPVVLCAVVLCVWMVACAEPERDAAWEIAQFEPDLQDATDADAESAAPSSAEPPYTRLTQQCYARAASQAEIHAIGQYLALGDTMLAVRVSIPEAPRLARCIEEAVADEVPPGPPSAANQFASGSFAIDLGGPPRPLQPGDIERHFDAHQAGLEAMMRDLLARGVLPRDHFFVREVLGEP